MAILFKNGLKMKKRQFAYFLILFICLPMMAPNSPCYSEEAKDRGAWWVSVYGALTEKDSPYVERAHKIFKKVLNASDKRANRFPRLVILRYQGDPWAIALKDGTILLTRKALKFCYKGVKKSTGDSRLAFVLGHELAHLAKDDFWHLSAFQTVTKFGKNSAASKELTNLLAETGDVNNSSKAKQISKKKELHADSYGLLYASMAGFDPKVIINDKGVNFFRSWSQQLRKSKRVAKGSHPSPEKRASLLLSNLRSVQNDLDLFHIGVRLYQTGRYKDALDFLTIFNEKFPCREVFNNIGLIHYQEAMEKLAGCDKNKCFRFKLSSILDTETMAEIYRRKCDFSLFNKARRYFKMACEKDASYIPSRINLSSAYIMSGMYSKALAVLDDAATIDGNNIHLLNNKAIAMYLMGPEINVDLHSQSTVILKQIIERDSSFSEAYYNLARLYNERNRQTTAAKYWKSFIKNEPFGNYAEAAAKELGINRQRALTKQYAYRSLPFLPPVQPGDFSVKTKKYLKKMKQREVELGTISGDYYQAEGELVVVLEDIVELYETDTRIPYSKVKNRLSALRPKRVFNSVSGIKTIVYDNFAIDIKNGTIVKALWFEKLTL